MKQDGEATKKISTAVKSSYEIKDFARIAHEYSTTSDVVKTALKLSGKAIFTKEDAGKIIKEFLNRKVG